MKKLLLLSIISLFLTNLCFSQIIKSGNLKSSVQNNRDWKTVDKNELVPNKTVLRESFSTDFIVMETNFSNLKSSLILAPDRFTSSTSNVEISLPNVNGQIERFQIFEASNFAPELQAQFPEIRAYVGIGIDDKNATLRLSIDSRGIQAMIFRVGKRNEFIEPYTLNANVYAIYESSRIKGSLPFTCSTIDTFVEKGLKSEIATTQLAKSGSGELLNFRLAMSCNGEYTQYFGGTIAGALAGINASITRVNGVFEKDFAIHLQIIANTSTVIYTNAATDPYTTMGNWNNQLQTTLTNVIGNANYDVGHMFGATGGGGNAGCIGCVCETGKGSGITSPSDAVPAGDTFDIDYVAHELGHQFGGNHTFSMNVEGSGVNVEPGSGSTIMGYAGITSQDVQPNSDDYFVYASIKQVQDNMEGKTCPTRTVLTNGAPVVNAGLDYTIPKSTPFVLTGSAIDPNGNPLTYCWEQNDTATTQTGAASAASATKAGGPNWRSYDPVTTSTRYFPLLARVIANQSTTQGTEIAVEALSSVARTLNFVLTARDNVAGFGQTGSDATIITVNASAGPFLVTVPNTAVSWAVGSNQSVTWNVAGTTTNGVNATYVDVYLSTDGGLTYSILLASKVPNDGTETITVPNNVGTTNRIMVKGYRHIFYDISNANFSITAPISSFGIAFNGVAETQNKEACSGGTFNYSFPYTTYGGFSGVTNFTASGLPSSAVATFTPSSTSVNGTINLAITNTNLAAPGIYNVIVTGTSGAITKIVPFYLNLFNSNFSTLNLTSPSNLAAGQPTSLNLTWSADSNATLYEVQVANDNTFSTIISSATVATTTYTVTGLLEVTDYFWRVLPKNSSCAGNYSTTYKFTTGQTSCSDYFSTNIPITIPATANVTVNSTLNISNSNLISDLNLDLDLSHTYVNDLTITLISPAGTQVQLVVNPCAVAALNDIIVTFDDAGTNLVCGNNPAISGVIIPSQSLAVFNGEAINGVWTLRVLDSFNLDGGAINAWGLNICTTLNPLNIIENSIQDFVIYPNPNNGNFNVKFNSTSNNEIKIGVNDIRGREIFSKSYYNKTTFDENLQLQNLQSGVYLVNIQDGENKIVKKIIIQ